LAVVSTQHNGHPIVWIYKGDSSITKMVNDSTVILEPPGYSS